MVGAGQLIQVLFGLHYEFAVGMVGLAFAVAASVNFPSLFLAIYWRKLSTRGGSVGGFIGLITTVVCMVLGPTIWVDILGSEAAIFPYKHPVLFSMTAAFVSIWLVSLTDGSRRARDEAEAFNWQYVRSQTGLGAEGAAKH